MAKMYNRRHYNDIAETFRVHVNRQKIAFNKAMKQNHIGTAMGKEARLNQLTELVDEFTDTFARDNPNFSPERFRLAVYGKEGE